MSEAASREYAARMAGLAEALDWLDGDCAAHGVAPDDVLRLRLVLEELYTNTVQHGHGGDCDEPVRIGWQAEAQHLMLHYADRAPAFDPRPQAAAPLGDAEAADWAERPIGRLGLLLVGQLCENLDYRHEDGWNTLRLRLRRGG